MRKGIPLQVEQAEEDSLSGATTVAALIFLAEKFPHRQFNSAELSIISGIGRTAMSQIKNAPDTPFSGASTEAAAAGTEAFSQHSGTRCSRFVRREADSAECKSP